MTSTHTQNNEPCSFMERMRHKSGKREIGIAAFILLVLIIMDAVLFSDSPADRDSKGRIIEVVITPMVGLTLGCLGIHIFQANSAVKEQAKTERARLAAVPSSTARQSGDKLVTDGEAV